MVEKVDYVMVRTYGAADRVVIETHVVSITLAMVFALVFPVCHCHWTVILVLNKLILS